MRNIIKRVLTLFVVVGLLCSIQVGLAVNKFSAQTVTESEKTNVVKSASGIKSYDEWNSRWSNENGYFWSAKQN